MIFIVHPDRSVTSMLESINVGETSADVIVISPFSGVQNCMLKFILPNGKEGEPQFLDFKRAGDVMGDGYDGIVYHMKMPSVMTAVPGIVKVNIVLTDSLAREFVTSTVTFSVGGFSSLPFPDSDDQGRDFAAQLKAMQAAVAHDVSQAITDTQKAAEECMETIEEKVGIYTTPIYPSEHEFTIGTILGTGVVESSATNRAHSSAYISCKGMTSVRLKVVEGYKYAAIFYQSESVDSHIWANIETNSDKREYPIPTNGNYVRFVVGRTDDAVITVEEASAALSIVLVEDRGFGIEIAQEMGDDPEAVMSQKATTEYLKVIESKLGGGSEVELGKYGFAKGTILGTGAVESSATNRAHTGAYINMQGATSFTVSIASGYKYTAIFYQEESEASHIWANIETNSNSKEYAIPASGNYMRIAVGRADDATITVDEALAAINVTLNGNTAAVKLSVGTFNIGHFSKGGGSNPAGTASEKRAYRRILAAMDCDVIGINENDEYYDADATEPSYNAVYAMFKHYLCSSKNQYDCYGVLSDHTLGNEKRAFYTAQHWQGRGYHKCELTVGGKTVVLINTQLEWSDKDVRRQQIAELIEEANHYPYVIIMGDFNPDNRTDGQVPAGETSADVWKEDYALWQSAGYSIANGGYFGAFNTLASYEGNVLMPWDNIIVSSNIRIKSVKRIKDAFLTDHYPLRADLILCNASGDTADNIGGDAGEDGAGETDGGDFVFTDEVKQDIVDAVIEALPIAEEVSF